MKTIEDLQRSVEETFLDAFGRTPLTERLKDILGEAIELQRYTDLKHLREEAGDLLSSLLMLFNEADWDVGETILETLHKIERRKKQYHTLGRKTKVAVLGGAFDPITKGHIETAQFVLDISKKFDEVWLMPCHSHMNGKEMAPAEHRLEMCRIASRMDGRIHVSDYEVKHQLSGESYKLAKRLLAADSEFEANYSFSFVIGQDNANTFHNWVNFEELERLIPFVVVPRVGTAPDFSNPWYLKPPHIYLVGEREMKECSSTEVRMHYARITGSIPQTVHSIDKIQEMMDVKVMNYIAAEGLDKHYAERGKASLENLK